MASQTAVKRASTSTKSRAETQVSEAKPARKQRVFDYSRFRVTIQNPDDFCRYLAGYPSKGSLCAYVYRLLPKIDLKLIGRESNHILETVDFERVTPQAIADEFGRGKYMVLLNDSNRLKGEREVAKGFYRLEDEDKPAVYDIRALVLSHGDNTEEINRLVASGVLVRDANGAPRIRTAADTQAPPAAEPAPRHDELISKDLLGQVLLKVVTQGTQSAGDSFKQSIEMAKLMTQQNSQAQLSPDQLADLVVAKLERTTKTVSNGDFFETYERVESFIEKVRGPQPAPAVSADAPWWAQLGLGLLDRVDRWAPVVIQAVQLRAQNQPRQNGHRKLPPNQQPPEQANMTVIDRIEQIAVLGFEQMQKGMNGFDFAAWVCNYHPGGLEVYRMLEPQGPPGVMGLVGMNQRTAHFVTDPQKRAQVEAFLSEFFSFDPAGTSAEQELEPMEPGSEAGAARSSSAAA